MKSSAIFLLLLHLLTPCSAYYASSIIQINSRSLDTSAALRQAAAVLNVGEPGKI